MEVCAEGMPEEFAANEAARDCVHETVPVAVCVNRNETLAIAAHQGQECVAEVTNRPGAVSSVSHRLKVGLLDGESSVGELRAVERLPHL